MGAGASSKGKSPGSAAPGISPPPQIGTIGQNTMNLGSYESQFINEPWSLGNWGMNLATGGTGPQVQQNPSQGGPQTGFFGTPSTTAGEVQTFGGGAGGGGGGTTGAGGGTRTQPFNPTTGQGGTGPFGGISLPGILGGFGAGENAAWNTATNPYPGTAPENFGPQFQNISNQEAKVAQQESAIGKDISLVQNKGQWLTPQQEAAINQQTKSNEAALAQQEGSMGLTGSTQATQLGGEAALAGEATKGQLQQQNMQLVQGWQGLEQQAQGLQQGWQKLSQAETGLSLVAQQQAFSQFQNIAQLSATEQGQLFQEGTQGYQLMQTFMSAVTQPYGISLQAFTAQLQAEEAQVADQVSLQSSAISADQSGQNQVVSSIGSVLSSILSAK
jgi:hypothetical protein